MLKGAANAQRHVYFRLDGLTGGTDLSRFFQPFGIYDRPRTGDDSSHGLGQLVRNFNIILVLDSTTD